MMALAASDDERFVAGSSFSLKKYPRSPFSFPKHDKNGLSFVSYCYSNPFL